MNAALIVFAKRPRPGRVKTRLTTVLSETDAAALYRAFLEDALDQYARLRADVRLYLAPGGSDGADEDIHRNQFLQEGSDLGERMLQAFAETFAAGYGRAVVIGTDHPTLPNAFIEKAFDLLDTPQSVVLGPAEDGGYYLLGMNDLRPMLFRGMSYSHDAVFDETVDRAAASGASLSILPAWYDVDTPQQLERLANDLAEGAPGADRTRALLTRLRERHGELRIRLD